MAFRYRLRPDVSQLRGCERHCADARFVWNLALEQANYWRPGWG
ncbi:MAG: helix-turn-helix domain-containing protein, partial [Acidimicrobiia bacterium]